MIQLYAQPGPPLDSFLPAELSKAIENAVLRIIELLNDSNFIVCRSVVTTLGEISKQRKRSCHPLDWFTS